MLGMLPPGGSKNLYITDHRPEAVCRVSVVSFIFTRISNDSPELLGLAENTEGVIKCCQREALEESNHDQLRHHLLDGTVSNFNGNVNIFQCHPQVTSIKLVQRLYSLILYSMSTMQRGAIIPWTGFTLI